MLEIIKCKICEQSHVPLNQTAVMVGYRRSLGNCECCGVPKKEEFTDFLCSTDCWLEYMRGKVRHTDKLEAEMKAKRGKSRTP